MEVTLASWMLLAAGVAMLLPRVVRRLQLSRAKHPSLAGHARMARLLARLLPGYELGDEEFFAADGAPADVAQRRRLGLAALADRFRQLYSRSAAATAAATPDLPDLEFTGSYRVPWPFSRYIRQRLAAGSFVVDSCGVQLTDLDGNRLYDLSGAYGVNLFGYDFYKDCLRDGAARVADLGPVLGPYHPLVASNVTRLRKISGLDAVSFHMSGTEAVMQAVRLARYHTRRTHLVRFCGAYHGWWGDVQPGVGNPQVARETFTLKELDAASLTVLRGRSDIACVLVNPLQALHPNAAAPSDSALISGRESRPVSREAYAAWLRQLREVCSARGIVLIFDEVFVGFRLAPGGAQEYYGVAADLVTYGKTLGGGLPVGVLCGRADLMRRYRADRPADICFARGTFNAHPTVMGTMAAFLDRLEMPAVRDQYEGLDELWAGRADRLNAALAEADLPVRLAALSTIWTVNYLVPGRYHWLLQYYLRAEGLLLSWVGSGRLIFSLNYSDAAFAEVVRRFVAAGRAMARDGWWWRDAQLTAGAIRRQVLLELLSHGRRRNVAGGGAVARAR
jgi:glutamate-1-semialdehyde 2,1-aminomutase